MKKARYSILTIGKKIKLLLKFEEDNTIGGYDIKDIESINNYLNNLDAEKPN